MSINWSEPDANGISTAWVRDEGGHLTQWQQDRNGWSWPVPHQEQQPPADRDISTDQVVTLDTTVYEQEPDAMPYAGDDEEIDL
ncbi:hypothetical protein AB0H03_17640 [Streptomyces sparsogenes]|uniref:hypothetical protein n=1 Tax=Streptomyces sparsogenes TaxID=67365 RepID=UPI00340D996B